MQFFVLIISLFFDPFDSMIEVKADISQYGTF